MRQVTPRGSKRLLRKIICEVQQCSGARWSSFSLTLYFQLPLLCFISFFVTACPSSSRPCVQRRLRSVRRASWRGASEELKMRFRGVDPRLASREAQQQQGLRSRVNSRRAEHPNHAAVDKHGGETGSNPSFIGLARRPQEQCLLGLLHKSKPTTDYLFKK